LPKRRWRIYTEIGGAAYGCTLCRQMEVIYIDMNIAILIVAIVTAAISFAALILKVVEVARNK
jgi:hypothetical protein